MSTSSSDARPKAAFLFPGQGAQAVGMGLDLYQSYPAAKAVFDEVDEAIGEPFSRIIFEGPEDELRKTVNTQPGILTVSIACLKAAEEALGSDRMPVAAMAAGHSLGEYTALVAAGALSVTDGVRLVRERGRLMQYASELTEGGMAAILGLEEAALAEVCREAGYGDLQHKHSRPDSHKWRASGRRADNGVGYREGRPEDGAPGSRRCFSLPADGARPGGSDQDRR